MRASSVVASRRHGLRQIHELSLSAPASTSFQDSVGPGFPPAGTLRFFACFLQSLGGLLGRGIYLTWAMQHTTILSDSKGLGMDLASQCEGFQMCLVMQVIDRGAGMMFSISV